MWAFEVILNLKNNHDHKNISKHTVTLAFSPSVVSAAEVVSIKLFLGWLKHVVTNIIT